VSIESSEIGQPPVKLLLASIYGYAVAGGLEVLSLLYSNFLVYPFCCSFE
jgi:hypothetical protein